MKVYNLYFFVLLTFMSTVCIADSIVEVKNIKLLNMSYAAAKIEVDYIYDGSIGNRVFFGATAITNENVKGGGFRPYIMSKGRNKSVIELVRPDVMHNDSFTSHSIDFQPYTRNISKHVIVAYEVIWPSYDKKFSKTEQLTDPDQVFSSIEMLRINEDLYASLFVIRSINSHGLTANQLNVIYKPLEDKTSQSASIRIAEGISVKDMKLLVKIIERENLEINSLYFISKDHSDYKYGFVDILEEHLDGLGTNAKEIIELIKSNQDIINIYKVADFKPTENQLSNIDLLEKATGLIIIGGYAQLAEANTILKGLLANQYYNPLVFFEFSKLLFKKYSLKPAYLFASLIFLYFIGTLIYKRFIRLPDIETISVDYDDPIIQEQIKNSKSQLNRFIEGLEQGKLEALIKFPLKTNDAVEHVWGLAHSKKSSHIITSLDSEPKEGIDDKYKERMPIHVNDIEDWMLIDSSGNTLGGYSFLAMAQLYEKKYGKLPKRYVRQLEQFNDFSWTTKNN